MIDEKCLRVLENLIQPLQGDVEANLMLILNGTISLNKFHKISSVGTQKIDSIVHWFISLLDKYPSQTCLVLSSFIKHILTLKALSGDTTDRLRNIDICVQYDSAMYTKCNQSVVEYLKELASSSDLYDRESCVEMVGKMLCVDSLPCSWSTLSETIPREIDLFGLLVTKLLDSNNSVKVRAVNLFMKVTQSGNAMSKKILQVRVDSFGNFTIPYNLEPFRASFLRTMRKRTLQTRAKTYPASKSSTICQINCSKSRNGT